MVCASFPCLFLFGGPRSFHADCLTLGEFLKFFRTVCPSVCGVVVPRVYFSLVVFVNYLAIVMSCASVACIDSFTRTVMAWSFSLFPSHVGTRKSVPLLRAIVFVYCKPRLEHTTFVERSVCVSLVNNLYAGRCVLARIIDSGYRFVTGV